MPRTVQDIIRKYLPCVNADALLVMREDVRDAGYWGDEKIDKPGWMKFLADIEAELENRK
jgi:hypothetical protein